MEYRIIEHLERYTIEIKEEEVVTHGWLWWRKKEVVTKWRRVAENGQALFIYMGFSPSPPLKRFKTLEEAMEMVKVFQKQPVYHYCDPVILSPKAD